MPLPFRIPVGDADTDFLNSTFILPVSCLACQQTYITGTARIIHTHPIERYHECGVIYLFYWSTDAADYLVNHGVPFRDAHGIVGRIVLYCLDKKIPIDDMSLEELKAISPVFEEDIYDAISMETCVNKRLTVGAPGKEAMEKVIEKEREYLSKEWM